MKVICVGGGPATLYLSILLKLRNPHRHIVVHEKNQEGATYGWGVTYWPDMLDTLTAQDSESALALEDESVRWRDGVAHVGERTTTHHGDTGYAISRHRLLGLLTHRATSLGVEVRFGHAVTPNDPLLADADLVVAGDGARSALRTHHADAFGTRITTGRNRFIWLGTTKVFRSFTFAFVETEHGWLWCYAYGFDGAHSTCIVECSSATWEGLGLDVMPQAASLRLLEHLLAAPLDGHRLMGRADAGGPAPWQNFPTVTNRTWSHGNLVLIGDAAHTTHYSIGAGTTLALRDAIALADALHTAESTPAALARYERARKRDLLSTQSAARHSAGWYENLTRYIHLAPHQMFALLGQRHSPLLPYVPPQLYYRIDRAVNRARTLRSIKRRLGHGLARALQND